MKHHELYVTLLGQARVVVSFVEETFGSADELADGGLGGDDDDRDLMLRVADHVATANGYTNKTDPTYEQVVDVIDRSLRDERRHSGVVHQTDYVE